MKVLASSNTACPLDCYDACSIVYTPSKLKASKKGHTQGFLCPHMNHYHNFKTIDSPTYQGKKISLDKAFSILDAMLRESLKNEILHYRGAGNFALMQEVTDHFFASYGATLTDGTLCDGAGEAGILKGRGSNKNMPLLEIAKSEVVILWGRNPHTTSSHLLPLLKDKSLITVDPVKTKIAKKSDIFVQIKPNSDIYLAVLIFQLLYEKSDTKAKYANGIDEYFRLTQRVDRDYMLKEVGLNIQELENIVELLEDKKVAIVCGLGIQKYKSGADTMRAIDAVAVALDLFGKEGCGVAYLGSSRAKIESPFYTESQRVSKVDTAFEKYKTVFIQGSNPLSQMPNTLRVKESLSQVKNLVYFGLYENETSELAHLVIPAKTFLHKNDIRTSYSHNALLKMPKMAECEAGVSEYDLSARLCSMFDIEIKSEEEYITHFKSFMHKNEDISYSVKGREEVPYKNGFDTSNKQFSFLKEIGIIKKKSESFYLITPKSATSLNSQFRRSEGVALHSSLGFEENQLVKVSSLYGDVELRVSINNDVRADCILIYSGTKGVNRLTTSEHSFEGKSAIFQEEMVKIERVNS